jgi:preprotein translocase subunit SecE
MNKLIAYLKGSREELSKVVWPSREIIVNHSVMVIGISIAVAIFLGAIDFILTKVLEVVIR